MIHMIIYLSESYGKLCSESKKTIYKIRSFLIRQLLIFRKMKILLYLNFNFI